jgi:hypothetical protein
MEANLDFATPAAILVSQLAQLATALENPPSLLIDDVDVKSTYLNELRVVKVADILKYAERELDTKKKAKKKEKKSEAKKDERMSVFVCGLFFYDFS